MIVPFLTGCTGGWYGINCSQQCVGHCRDGTTCNYLTGLCDRGCEAGWRGTRCDTGKTCGLTWYTSKMT